MDKVQKHNSFNVSVLNTDYLHVPKIHALKANGWKEVKLYAFVTSALDGNDKRHSPAALPGSQWTGGRVGPRAVLGVVALILHETFFDIVHI
jgi:hypothetical protein